MPFVYLIFAEEDIPRKSCKPDGRLILRSVFVLLMFPAFSRFQMLKSQTIPFIFSPAFIFFITVFCLQLPVISQLPDRSGEKF